MTLFFTISLNAFLLWGLFQITEYSSSLQVKNRMPATVKKAPEKLRKLAVHTVEKIKEKQVIVHEHPEGRKEEPVEEILESDLLLYDNLGVNELGDRLVKIMLDDRNGEENDDLEQLIEDYPDDVIDLLEGSLEDIPMENFDDHLSVFKLLVQHPYRDRVFPLMAEEFMVYMEERDYDKASQIIDTYLKETPPKEEYFDLLVENLEEDTEAKDYFLDRFEEDYPDLVTELKDKLNAPKADKEENTL